MKRYFLLLVLFTLAFASCKKEEFDPVKQAEKDEEMIKAYLKAKNINAQKDTASGLYYYIETPGTGIQASALSTVTVNYRGELMLSGNTFDQAEGAEVPLPQTIQGWKIGVPKIREGGKIRLFIPSALAYKNRTSGAIPANSVLIFYIDLIDVEIS